MCGQRSSKVKHIPDEIEYNNIVNAIHVFCTEHHMQAVDRSIKQDFKTGKWSVNLKSIMDNKTYLYEMFVHTERNCAMINKKSLYGPYFMPYEEMSKIDDVVGFLYRSEGNLTEFYKKNSSLSDEVLGHIFSDVVAAVIDLQRVKKAHEKLNWENVEVVKDVSNPNLYHGKLNALEYVVRHRNVDARRLAPLAHRPPEVIHWGFLSLINLCKAHTYILGSLLLTLLTDKYMGGESFQPLKDKQNAGSTYDNIKKNFPQLDKVFSSSRLSSRFQNLLREMLEIDPEKRICLNQISSSLSGWNLPAFPGEPLNKTRTNSQISRLSIMTNDLSIDDPVLVRKSVDDDRPYMPTVEVLAVSTRPSHVSIAASMKQDGKSSAVHLETIEILKENEGLSFRTGGQGTFVNDVKVDPEQRLGLNQVSSSLSGRHLPSLVVSSPRLGPVSAPVSSGAFVNKTRTVELTDSQIDRLSIMTNDLSMENLVSARKSADEVRPHIMPLPIEPSVEVSSVSTRPSHVSIAASTKRGGGSTSVHLETVETLKENQGLSFRTDRLGTFVDDIKVADHPSVVHVAPKTIRKRKYGGSKIPTKVITVDHPLHYRLVKPKSYSIYPRSSTKRSKRVEKDDDASDYNVQIHISSSSSEQYD